MTPQATQFAKLTSHVVLKVASISESIIGGYKTVQMIVPTSAFLKTSIPNKANSRDYTGEKNKAVKPMVHTLKTEPEMFRFKNNGIRMVASELVRNDDMVTIYFSGDEGIFNGGHTYRVCKTFGVDKAYVLVTVDLNLPKEQLAKISLALNMSKKLELTSQGEKQGAFDWVKKVLPTEEIIYKEGDTGIIPVEEVLKVANLFRPGRGKSYAEGVLTDSLTRKNKVVRENNEKQVLVSTSYILADMWNLFNAIRTDATIIKQLPSDYTKKGKEVLPSLVLVMLTGIRYMTEINRNNIPTWKNGFNVQVALDTSRKLAKGISTLVKKQPYKEMKTNHVVADDNFHDKVQNLYAKELL